MNSDFLRPAGYAYLIEQYNLRVVPNWHASSIGKGTTQRIETDGTVIRQTFPAVYWPGDALGQQLEFALKYDGTNLQILTALFKAVRPRQITDFVASKLTGKYARRVWYLFELLTGRQLSLPDLTQGNYVDLLEPDEHYTGDPRYIPRQRVRDNLLGDARFCPIVRRTEVLRQFELSDLPARCRQIVQQFPVTLLRRALAYLYTKETKSSFEIEHIAPDAGRTERFIALLQLAQHESFISRQSLIDLQNRIGDPRFVSSDYRTDQNYVGQTVQWKRERVHFISPRPDDIPLLMEGLLASHDRLHKASVNAVVHAAVLAYAFVFLHPFDDGNGRIHRFLIHNVLALRAFTSQEIIFPVSAVMLKQMQSYDASLEAFSKPLAPLIDYSLDDSGRMTVQNDTADYYRYIDLTPQAEALFGFIRETIESNSWKNSNSWSTTTEPRAPYSTWWTCRTG